MILSKPGSRDYGVEVMAPPDVVRLQVRVVGSDRPSAPRTPQRDAEQETSWCAEFDRLKSIVAELGSRIEVQRAVAAGAVPVPTVAISGGTAPDDATRARRPLRRRLP